MKKKRLFNFILCFVLAFLCIGKLYSAKASYDASNEAKSIIDGIISFNAGNPPLEFLESQNIEATEENSKKYPVEKSKGSSKKYTEL